MVRKEVSCSESTAPPETNSERERDREEEDGEGVCVCDSWWRRCCWLCRPWILQQRSLSWRTLHNLRGIGEQILSISPIPYLTLLPLLLHILLCNDYHISSPRTYMIQLLVQNRIPLFTSKFPDSGILFGISDFLSLVVIIPVLYVSICHQLEMDFRGILNGTPTSAGVLFFINRNFLPMIWISLITIYDTEFLCWTAHSLLSWSFSVGLNT